MVLYHANGRVVIAHEDYLEQTARKKASEKKYEDQIEICNRRSEVPSTTVEIVIHTQHFKTLYSGTYGMDNLKDGAWEWLPHNQLAEERITVDRAALIRGSALAEDHFRWNPASEELTLPVSWPRHHAGEQTFEILDAKMAYIRSNEILSHIVPWLRKVGSLGPPMEEGKRKDSTDRTNANDQERDLMDPENPKGLHIPIPDTILSKIHLYNTMLQLGLPRFVQRPLIDALILQMYKTPLRRCHLETLEITIGRLNSRSMAVLDPVICHFIGTYAFRGIKDRQNPDTPHEDKEQFEQPKSVSKLPPVVKTNKDENATRRPPYINEEGRMNFRKAGRKTLKFIAHPAGRSKYPNDTMILPPELPVLGHSIRHWSGLRYNDSAAAVFTGFPLNIGESYKYIQRGPPRALSVNRVTREQTNRLAQHRYYWKNRPGLDGGTEMSGAASSTSNSGGGGGGAASNGGGGGGARTEASTATQAKAKQSSKRNRSDNPDDKEDSDDKPSKKKQKNVPKQEKAGNKGASTTTTGPATRLKVAGPRERATRSKTRGPEAPGADKE